MKSYPNSYKIQVKLAYLKGVLQAFWVYFIYGAPVRVCH